MALSSKWGSLKRVLAKALLGLKGLGLKLEALLAKIPVINKITKLSTKKKRIAYIALALAILLPISYLLSSYVLGEQGSLQYTEYTVERGNVEVSISGSGTVTPINQYSVMSLVEGDVLQDTFQEGDTVNEGDTLYVVDAEEMENTLEKADISLEKQQMSYQTSMEAYAGLTVASPMKGMIDELYVSKGDAVQSGTKIAKVVDNDTMTARIPFSESDAEGLYVGQNVTVTVENTFEQIAGQISKVYNSKRVLDGYITVTDVDITLSNPGYLQTGTYVSATANSVACYAPGELEASREKIVTAETSGTISKISVVGAYLNTGGTIATLDSDDADDDLKSSQLSLRESQLSYDSTQKQLENYTITAPIAGSVISKTVKAGDTIDKDATTELCVIADMSTITFEMSVDELDIASMKAGQEVDITADALPDDKFTGYVDNIGLLGTATDGVTSYPVTIVINEGDGLWPGMNVTGEIIVDSAEDVLLIPVDAVNRGNTVLVKESTYDEETANQLSTKNSDSKKESSKPATGGGITSGAAMTPPNGDRTSGRAGGAPEGYKYVTVTLGLNNDSYIEVTSGLPEGTEILVTKATSTAGSTTGKATSGDMGGGGMPSGGGGGMPSGGGGGAPPSGGGGAPGM